MGRSLASSGNAVWLSAGLCAAAVVAGAPCGFSAQYLTVEAALRLCFPDAARFEPVALAGAGATRCWAARGPGGLLGHAFWDAVIGKHLCIDYMVAVGTGGDVLRLEVLVYRESYGGEIRGAGWRRQFHGFGAARPPRFQRDIANIGGATLSCRHVTEGVGRLLKIFEEQLR